MNNTKKNNNNQIGNESKLVINKKNYSTSKTNTSDRNKNDYIGIKHTDFNIEKKIENIIKKEEKKLYEQLNKIIEDSYSKIDRLEKMTKNLVKSTEVIEGKLNTLDDIEKIKEMLQKDSNNTLRPSNLEEEVLTNLGEYGERIIKELTLASRHYAINKSKIENARELEEKYQEELRIRKEEYKKQEKLDIVENICKKYDNLDKIFELETIEAGILQNILSDSGVEVVEEYSNGQIIEITNENRVNLEGKISFSNDSLGKYKIIKSAYVLNGVIKQKAEVEKVEG